MKQRQTVEVRKKTFLDIKSDESDILVRAVVICVHTTYSSEVDRVIEKTRVTSTQTHTIEENKNCELRRIQLLIINCIFNTHSL